MILKISNEGIIYDDETQAAVGFLGAEVPFGISYGEPNLMREVMREAHAGRLTIHHERRVSERRAKGRRTG